MGFLKIKKTKLLNLIEADIFAVEVPKIPRTNVSYQISIRVLFSECCIVAYHTLYTCKLLHDCLDRHIDLEWCFSLSSLSQFRFRLNKKLKLMETRETHPISFQSRQEGYSPMAIKTKEVIHNIPIDPFRDPRIQKLIYLCKHNYPPVSTGGYVDRKIIFKTSRKNSYVYPNWILQPEEKQNKQKCFGVKDI